MKTHLIPVLVAVIIALFAGCKEDEVAASATPRPPLGTPFSKGAWDYATNHFFVDTLYRGAYEAYYRNDPPVLSPGIQIVDEEVWVKSVLPPVSSVRTGVAFITLPAQPAQGYDSTLRALNEVPGERESALFVRANRTEYEIMGEGYIGVISLRGFDVSENQVVGIAYRRADGTQFGEFVGDVPDTSAVIVLKMVKPRFLNREGPVYRVAWDQLLKNIYDIGGRHISAYGFTLNILYGPVPPGSQNQIHNQPLLRVLGLDRYSQDGTPTMAGDGIFDFRPGITIDENNGEIILPSLRPFDGGIRKYFTDRGLPLPDSTYYSPWIYDSTKVPAPANPGTTYSFDGRALPY